MRKSLKIWYSIILSVAALVIVVQLLLGTGVISEGGIRQFINNLLGNSKPQYTYDASSSTGENGTADVAPGDRAVILATGDILVHSPQLDAQYNETDNTYNFDNNFKYVKEYIEAADYSIVNFETTMAGNIWRDYGGYPSFNTPDQLAEAVRKAGFDMVLTANNHLYDSSEKGFFRTLEVLKGQNLDIIGTKTAKTEKSYLVREINNIKIGFANFCYETTIPGEPKSLNGIPLSATVAELIDTFMYDDLEAAYARMQNTIYDMKNEGAEYIIFFIHWGDEYQTIPNSYQKQMAARLSDMGVNAVIGGHPHVLQPVDVIEGSNGNKTFVAYSTGNFISNQRFEMMDLPTSHTEDGMMLTLELERSDTGEIELKKATCIPTWVHKYFTAAGKPVYEIVPLEKALADYSAYNLNASADAVRRAQKSLENTMQVMSCAEGPVEEAFAFETRGTVK